MNMYPTPPPAAAAGPGVTRKAFRLWSEPLLASPETWLEIRARANFRSKAEERRIVMELRAKAPAVINKVRNFRMFGDDHGVLTSELRGFLTLQKKDRRKLVMGDVELEGDAWCTAAVVPKYFAEYLLDASKPEKRPKVSSGRTPLAVLEAFEECMPSLAACALRKDSELWQQLASDKSSSGNKEDYRGWVGNWEENLRHYVSSLGHIVECLHHARELLQELDEVERYACHCCSDLLILILSNHLCKTELCAQCHLFPM